MESPASGLGPATLLHFPDSAVLRRFPIVRGTGRKPLVVRTSRRFPVVSDEGATVAYIETGWLNHGFRVVAPDGAALCTGRLEGLFIDRVEVLDPNGRRVVTVHSGILNRFIRLPGQASLTVRTRTFTRHWQVVDAARDTVLTATRSRTGAVDYVLRNSYLVQHNPRLTLVEVIGIVQGYRLLTKRARITALGDATSG